MCQCCTGHKHKEGNKWGKDTGDHLSSYLWEYEYQECELLPEFFLRLRHCAKFFHARVLLIGVVTVCKLLIRKKGMNKGTFWPRESQNCDWHHPRQCRLFDGTFAFSVLPFHATTRIACVPPCRPSSSSAPALHRLCLLHLCLGFFLGETHTWLVSQEPGSKTKLIKSFLKWKIHLNDFMILHRIEQSYSNNEVTTLFCYFACKSGYLCVPRYEAGTQEYHKKGPPT